MDPLRIDYEPMLARRRARLRATRLIPVRTAAVAAAALLLLLLIFPIFCQHRGSHVDHRVVNMHFLAIALRQYSEDHSGLLPPMKSAAYAFTTLKDYTQIVESPSGVTCSAMVNPVTGRLFVPNRALSGRKYRGCAQTEIAFYDATVDSFGRQLAVSLDGRVHSLTGRERSNIVARRAQ